MSQTVEFTVEATKPNISAPSLYDPNPEQGPTKHTRLEDLLVKPFSQLRIQNGWTFNGESFCDGFAGYGKVECCNIEGTQQVDPMSLIEGDLSPLSYLQAAMVYREIEEFGRFWHSSQWGVEEVLDQNLAQEQGLVNNEEYETELENWSFKGRKPVKWNPTYKEKDGIVKITYYSINPVGQEKLVHNIHTFEKRGYTQTLRTKEIAYGSKLMMF